MKKLLQKAKCLIGLHGPYFHIDHIFDPASGQYSSNRVCAKCFKENRLQQELEPYGLTAVMQYVGNIALQKIAPTKKKAIKNAKSRKRNRSK